MPVHHEVSVQCPACDSTMRCGLPDFREDPVMIETRPLQAPWPDGVATGWTCEHCGKDVTIRLPDWKKRSLA